METLLEPVMLRADKGAVTIVDQTKLPSSYELLDLADARSMYNAIEKLQVRGAPSIGVCAAWCYYVLARQAASEHADTGTFLAALSENAAYLNSSRPTAVNLFWALRRMEEAAHAHAGEAPAAIVDELEACARAIQDENTRMATQIACLGASLLEDGWGVLTHCNAGPLACGGYGTGQGPFYYAHEHGKKLHVFVDETRPLLQGARLTSYELARAGIDFTLICDNMASLVMSQGRVQACMVGCDRVAANGDVANKIGTSGVAILAAYYNIPFYVLGPTSTIDLSCATGAEIPIELRSPDEIAQMFYEQPMAPEGARCYNPAFDVTDHCLITAIVTERGICYPPYTDSLAELFA